MSEKKDPGREPKRAKILLRVASKDKKRELIAGNLYRVVFENINILEADELNSLSLTIHNNERTIDFNIVTPEHREKGVYLTLHNKKIFFYPADNEYDQGNGHASIIVNGRTVASDIDLVVITEVPYRCSSIEVQNDTGNGDYKFKLCKPSFNNCTQYVQPSDNGGSGIVPTSHFNDGELLYLMAFKGANDDPAPDAVALHTIILDRGNRQTYTYRFDGVFNNPSME